MLENTIDRWIEQHTQDIIATLQGAIRIPSVMGDPAPGAPYGAEIGRALSYLLEEGRRLGFSAADVDGQVGVVEWGTGEPRLGILTHTDVVPAQEGWTYPAYGGEIHGGRVYGRGAMDDKGPIAAVLYAMAALRDAGFTPKGTVQLIIGTDEENEHRDMEYYLVHRPAPHFGFSPDGEFPVIYGEKGIMFLDMTETDPQADALIVSIEGGMRPNVVPDECVCRFARELTPEETRRIGDAARGMMEEQAWSLGGDTLAVHGAAAHGSMPEKGVNAVGRMLILLNTAGMLAGGSFAAFLARHIGMEYDGTGMGVGFSDEATGPSTLNLGELHIGPGEARAVLDMRYPATVNGDGVLDALRARAAETGAAIHVRVHHRPLYMEKTSDIVQTLLSVYREVTADQTEPFTIGGGTYAREIPNAVAFGPLFPGRPDVMHQRDEYYSIEDLIQITRIYARAIQALMK